MELKWREPATGFTVTLELRLACPEGFLGDGGKGGTLGRRLFVLALALDDRVQPARSDLAPLLGGDARLLERDSGQRPKTHLAPATSHGYPQEPLGAAILPLVQPETTTIVELARRAVLNCSGAEAVQGTHFQSTFLSTLRPAIP